MLRRPLLYVAVGMVTAILIEYYMGTAAALCVGIILLLAVFYMQKQDLPDKKKIIVWLVLFSYFLGTVSLYVQEDRLDGQQENLIYQSAFAGKVTEVEKKRTESGDRYVQMTVKTEYGKALVKYYNEDFHVIPGDTVDVQGTVSIPQGRRNPGCFDYALYLKSQNIPVTMTAKVIQIIDSGDSIYGKLYLVKESFMGSLKKSTDRDTAAMMRAIMFGDKGELDEDTQEVFQKNGTAHILAVSGLHIGIIYGFILKLWTLIGNITKGLICGKRSMAFFIFNSVFFGCYMVMANFSPSVVRAVIMVLLHVFAQLTNRYYDLSNAALLVIIMVLSVNPYMLFNVGFQMSFLAVLTLVMVMPFIKNIYTGVFLSSLVIQIGLGPFILYSFNYLSLISVFINVPVIFLAGFIVPAGLVSMALSGLPIFEMCAKAVQLLCKVLQGINNAVEIEGITTFQVSSPPLWLMAFYYLALLTLATEEGRLAVIRAAEVGTSVGEKLRDRCRYVVKVCVILIIVAVAFAHIAGDHFEDCDLTFVDVGQGDCMHLRINGHNYLIDGGGSENYNLGKKTLKPYLLKNGVSHIDGAFVTHLHTDHYKGICELAREGLVDRLYIYEGNSVIADEVCRETGLHGEDVEFLTAGDVLEFENDKIFGGSNGTVEILWPEHKSDHSYAEMIANSEDENASSMIMKVTIDGVSLLVTGDMGEELETVLVDECNLDSDILKVGHHGSKYSSSDTFLDAVSPDIAVIQVGKNNYGHPTPETLERLAERDVIVYRNDECGAIGFEIEDGEVKNTRKITY